MPLTKLDLKQIIQEEMQNLLEEETPTLRQKFEVGPKEIEAMLIPYSNRWWTNQYGHNRGTKMAPIVDDLPMGGPEAIRKFQTAHGRDPKEGDVVYYLGQNKRGDREYSTFTFGKKYDPKPVQDTPAQRRAKLKEAIEEEYDKFLGEAEEGEGTTIDISVAMPGGMAPFGIPQDQWEMVGTSAEGE
jgi:hypothetical protein